MLNIEELKTEFEKIRSGISQNELREWLENVEKREKLENKIMEHKEVIKFLEDLISDIENLSTEDVKKLLDKVDDRQIQQDYKESDIKLANDIDYYS